MDSASTGNNHPPSANKIPSILICFSRYVVSDLPETLDLVKTGSGNNHQDQTYQRDRHADDTLDHAAGNVSGKARKRGAQISSFLYICSHSKYLLRRASTLQRVDFSPETKKSPQPRFWIEDF